MPQILLMVAPGVRNEIVSKISKLGLALIADVEKVFDIQGEDDVAFSVLNLAYVIGEADVQVEIRYTVGADEYHKGEPFEPSKQDTKRLVETMSDTLRRILDEIVESASIWIIPVRESEFSVVTMDDIPEIGCDMCGSIEHIQSTDGNCPGCGR